MLSESVWLTRLLARETVAMGLSVVWEVFVNENSKDFASRLLERQLKKQGCRLITSFSSARRYIENGLRRSPEGEPTRG